MNPVKIEYDEDMHRDKRRREEIPVPDIRVEDCSFRCPMPVGSWLCPSKPYAMWALIECCDESSWFRASIRPWPLVEPLGNETYIYKLYDKWHVAYEDFGYLVENHYNKQHA